MAANRFVMNRTSTPSRTGGSVTVTSTSAGPSNSPNGPTLRLRATEEDATASSRHIQWAEDVVDNEGMGKKSSKVCCIYHKSKNAGDSSSDESSSDSSSDDSDSEPDLSRAQPARRHNAHRDDHDHEHASHDDGESDIPASSKAKGKGKPKARRASPNAYERVPRRKNDKT